MSILTEIFKKKGIETIEELEPDERETYQNYQKILSKDSLTLEDIEKFISDQIRIIEGKWRDYTFKDASSLIPYHTIYCVLRDVIKSPQVEREQLEKYLRQLHNL